MHLDRRFFFVLGASLLWALVVASVFYRLAAAGAHGRSAGPERPLVVAARPLPLGTTLTRECVQLKKVPENLLPKGGFSRVEDVIDRPVISAMQADEPVMESRLAARGSGLGLAPLIAPGMRAIAVRVNDVVGVAGFILPGMRVDVLVTGQPAGGSDTYTRTVLQNITVLSAGQTIETDGKSQTITTPVVTLLVNPEQAEALTLANNQGHVQLVLRNSADREVAGTPGRQWRELFGTSAAEPPRPELPVRKPASTVRRERPPEVLAQAPPAPKPETAEVTVIRGTVKTQETVRSKGEER